MNEFKTSINYKDVDISFVDASTTNLPGGYIKSFVFEVKETEQMILSDNYMLFKSLTNLEPTDKTILSKLKPGKYIVIEYNDYDDSDYPSAGGYFGLLDNYIKYVENTINEVKKATR